MTDPAFSLRRPATPKPARPASDAPKPPKLRQLALLSGLNCCPGQLDLFPTDGQLPQGDRQQEDR